MSVSLGVAGKKNIKGIRKLSDSEFEEFKKANSHLIQFTRDQNLFNIVRLNFEDYVKLLNEYLQEFIQNPRTIQSKMPMMFLNINRLIINYLSAIRTFLDHSETNLKKRYESDPQRITSFKNACSKEYDNNFSYRFVYELRNYVQHCGMPLGSLALGASLVNPVTNKAKRVMEVKFVRDELLEDSKWKAQIRDEIQKLPQEFDITSHLSEMMKCIKRINLILIEKEVSELIKNAKFLEKIVNETKKEQGVPCVIQYSDIKRTPSGEVKSLSMNLTWIPVGLVASIKKTGMYQVNKA